MCIMKKTALRTFVRYPLSSRGEHLSFVVWFFFLMRWHKLYRMTLYIVWLIKAWSFPMDLPLPVQTQQLREGGSCSIGFSPMLLKASNIWSHISTLRRNHRSRNCYYCCRRVLFLRVAARRWLQGESSCAYVQALLLHLPFRSCKAKPRTSEPLYFFSRKCSAPLSRFALASRNPRDLKEGMLLVQLKWIRPEHRTGFPEFGFTSQYRNHLEPSGDTRSTGSVISIPQCRLVRPRSHRGSENTPTSCLLCNLFSQFY